MSWTYSGDPSASDLDAVRYLVQDTNVRDQLASDEDINYELSLGGVTTAAVHIAETILTDIVRRGREAKTAEAYKRVIRRLRRRLAAGTSAGVSGEERAAAAFSRDVLSVLSISEND